MGELFNRTGNPVSTVVGAFAFILLLFFPPKTYADTLVITEGQGEYSLAAHMDMLEDKSASLKIGDVVGSTANFHPNAGGREHFGWTKSALWFRISVENASNAEKETVLWIPDSWIDRVECYTKAGDGWRVALSGDNIPQSRRPIQGPVIAFPLRLGAREISTIYIRAHSPEDDILLSFKLADVGTFGLDLQKKHAFTAFFVGVMLTIFIYSLALFVVTGNKLYLKYFLYVLGITIGMLIVKGYCQWLLWPEAGARVNSVIPVWNAFMFSLASIFVMSFLRTDSTVPRLDWILRSLVAMNAVAIVLALVMSDLTLVSIYTVHFPLIYTLVMIITGVVCAFKRVLSARLFLLAWVCSLVGIAIYVLKILGVFADTFFTNNAVEMGVAAEAILFSIAIGYQVRLLQMEHEAAQQAAMATEIGHSLELARLNERLEATVAERTAQLKESETRFRRLSDSAFEGIIVHENGIMLDVNDRCMEITGYSREELLGKNLVELLITPEHRGVVVEKIRSNNEGTYEIAGVGKDGGVIPIEVMGRSMDFQGRHARVAVFRDITNQKKTEKILRDAKEVAENATKLKNDFLSIVSHDLRSPLSSIQWMLKNLVMKGEDGYLPEKTMNTLGRMEASVVKLLSFVERLLRHSMIQGGKIVPEKRWVGVRALADELCEELQPQASAKNITIKNEIPNDMELLADPYLLRQVVQNLLSNSVKFTSDGEIKLIEIDEVTFEIQDTGIGLGDQNIDDLFKDEIRTTRLGTAGEAGTGLGLPHSRAIMLAHGGALTARNNPGGGSCFRVSFPKHLGMVLLVDSRKPHREMLRGLVEKTAQCAVVEAESEPDVLRNLKGATPDILVIGTGDGKTDVFTLIEHLRKNRKYDLLSIIAVGSENVSGPHVSAEKALSAGADCYLALPKDETKFQSAILTFLRVTPV